MKRLENKIALVTGGNSGIGFASAKRFLGEGATVVITGRRSDAVAEAVEALGEGVEGIVSDASDPADVDRLVDEIRRRHGRIDVLFLNAGIAPFAELADQSVEAWERVFATNVTGPYFTVQRARSLLSEGASIVITGSAIAVKGFAGTSAYAASKAAVRSLARTLTAELAPRGIRVNVLAPGPIETPIYGKLGKTPEEVEGMAAGFAAMVPLGRFGGADETANAALFLASDESSYVAGAELAVDGGIAQV